MTSGVHYVIIKTVKEDNIKEEEIMKVDIKRLFEELVADGTEPMMAKAVIESMIHTANEYHMVQEMFKGYIGE